MTKRMKLLAFGVVALTIAFFAACSSDGPMLIITPNGDVYSEEEYNELVESGQVDEAGNVIVEDTDAKSSSSKKATSSSGKASSSSSAKSGSSSSGKATSSSGDGDDDSSSSGKASSSSSAKDGSSSSAKDGSSSSAKAESSSSEPESSSAEVGKETVIDEDEGIFSIGTDDMTAVSDDAQSELDSLKEILDNGGTVDGFELADSEFNEETLLYEDFDENDFFCFTGEGEWLKITREQLGKHIPHYKNGQAWGNFRQFDVKFMDACAAVYIRRK